MIGSGPGGYVAAIRSGILGLKTALVEKDPFLGGTCLHRGCIPTKALLHTAHLYDELKHASDYGLKAESLGVDFPKVHKRKTAIVNRLARGIRYLMKKRKVEVFTGMGSLHRREDGQRRERGRRREDPRRAHHTRDGLDTR